MDTNMQMKFDALNAEIQQRIEDITFHHNIFIDTQQSLVIDTITQKIMEPQGLKQPWQNLENQDCHMQSWLENFRSKPINLL